MSPRTLSIVAALLTFTAGSVVVYDGWAAGRPLPTSIEFQQLVGGLGMGAELNMARCAFAFDPRLSSSCSGDRRSLLDGHRFCPCHSFSVAPISQFPRNGAPRVAFEWHASLD